MLGVDPARAFYGPGHVVAAAEQGAVAKLLIADSLYRCGTSHPSTGAAPLCGNGGPACGAASASRIGPSHRHLTRTRASCCGCVGACWKRPESLTAGAVPSSCPAFRPTTSRSPLWHSRTGSRHLITAVMISSHGCVTRLGGASVQLICSVWPCGCRCAQLGRRDSLAHVIDPGHAGVGTCLWCRLCLDERCCAECTT